MSLILSLSVSSVNSRLFQSKEPAERLDGGMNPLSVVEIDNPAILCDPLRSLRDLDERIDARFENCVGSTLR